MIRSKMIIIIARGSGIVGVSRLVLLDDLSKTLPAFDLPDGPLKRLGLETRRKRARREQRLIFAGESNSGIVSVIARLRIELADPEAGRLRARSLEDFDSHLVERVDTERIDRAVGEIGQRDQRHVVSQGSGGGGSGYGGDVGDFGFWVARLGRRLEITFRSLGRHNLVIAMVQRHWRG